MLLARDAINAPERFGYLPTMCLNAYLMEDGARRARLGLAELADGCLAELRRGPAALTDQERAFDWCRDTQPEMRERLISGIERAVALVAAQPVGRCTLAPASPAAP